MKITLNLNNKRPSSSTDLNPRVNASGLSKIRRLAETVLADEVFVNLTGDSSQEPMLENRNTIFSANKEPFYVAESSSIEELSALNLEVNSSKSALLADEVLRGVTESRNTISSASMDLDDVEWESDDDDGQAILEQGKVYQEYREKYKNLCDREKAFEYNQKAFDLFYKAAVEFDLAEAWRLLGDFYQHGWEGMEPDLKAAVYSYRRAADSGDVEAIVRLAYCYKYGRGTDLDTPKAFILFHEAAAGHRNALAMRNLGDFYQYGWGGIQPDLKEALSWYTKAVDLKDTKAMVCLGDLYQRGWEGIRPNLKVGARFYQRAANLGDVEAMVRLAYCYKYGRGIEHDHYKAFDRFDEAAEHGNAVAMRNLGDFYQYGWGGMAPDLDGWGGMAPDLDGAVVWYTKAAALGDADAKRALGDYHQSRNQGPRDLKTAFILYKEAAEQGNVMAISRLSRCYFHGIGTEKNSNMVDQLCKTMLQEIMKRRYK